jgi:hypothetical protein
MHIDSAMLQLEKVNDIHQRLAEVREENRLLYNTVQDLRGNIRVFCRVRPQGATGDASQIVVDVSWRSRHMEPWAHGLLSIPGCL